MTRATDIPAADKLRARLGSQFSAALSADPICNGRVASATVGWLADEAIRAAEAVRRKALTISPEQLETAARAMCRPDWWDSVEHGLDREYFRTSARAAFIAAGFMVEE